MAKFFSPMLDLLTNAECALDDLIHTMGRATIEAILLMSAAEVAGPKQQGKKTDRDIAYHGKQGGRVMLKERQLQVSKPRLRHRNPKPGESGEVEIPAYQVMNSSDATLADRIQRCRNHKIRDVVGHLPKDQKDQARLTMKAGFRLGGKQGKAKLEQYAKWLERDSQVRRHRFGKGLMRCLRLMIWGCRRC